QWDPWSIKDSDHRPAFGDCTFGHGTAVASTLAGNDTGIGTSPNEGNARGAKLYFQDIGTVGLDMNCYSGNGNADLLNYLPQDYADLFGPLGLVYNDPVAPVRVHSDSWGGTANVYDLQARMVDMFVWAHPDMTIVFAAGNCASTCTPGTIGTACPGRRDDPERRADPGRPDRVRSAGHREWHGFSRRIGHVAQQRTGFRPSPPFERPPALRRGRHVPHPGGRRNVRPVDGGRPELHVPCRHPRAREVRPHLERFPWDARGDEGARERSGPEGDRSRRDRVPGESFRAFP